MSRLEKDNKLQTVSFALAQSALNSLGIFSACKAITPGRPPENELIKSTKDCIIDFKFIMRTLHLVIHSAINSSSAITGK